MGRWFCAQTPPDLTTGYLQGHKPHRDPLHPDARYRDKTSVWDGTIDDIGPAICELLS